MLAQVIWWTGIILESILLIRGVAGKWYSHHRIFFLYIILVLAQSPARFVAYRESSQAYFYVYWITEFLGVVVGCGIVFEVYKVGLSAYPGAARMARNLLLFIFVLTFTKAFVDASSDPRWWPIASIMQLERDARVVQTAAIGAIVALFAVYAVPFGKNLRGIAFGYGMFVAVSIASLTFADSQAGKYLTFWQYLIPGSYLLTLVFWTTHLWSYQPQPVPAPTVRLEHDYQKVAAATRRRLQEARGYLGKATSS